MTDLHEAFKALKARNPLMAAYYASRELHRATEAGFAMIERACDPTIEDYNELNETKPRTKGEDQ